MTKVFGIVLFVGLLWVGLEVNTEGTQGAFGGAFAGLFGAPTEEADTRSNGERARAAVEQANRAGEERRQRLLGE